MIDYREIPLVSKGNIKSGKPIDDVKECTDPMCPLFDFRFGKNPFIKRIANLEALKKARETKTALRQSA